MSEAPARGVIVAHGDMAEGLIDAVRAITGIESDALVAISNRGLSPQLLLEHVRTACEGGRAFVFTDLPSGSCGFAGRLLARDVTGLAVLCGVNLPMLLDFVTHRDLPTAELVERLVVRARAAIAGSSANQPHGDPALPR